MKILIADDDPTTCRLLGATLKRLGYDVVVTVDGLAALDQLQTPDAAPIAILDWLMPGLDGLELCRQLRAAPSQRPLYIILLTGNNRKQDITKGLQAGADDYIVKPFDREELHARVQVGIRLVQLQQSLADRVRELEAALSRVKLLHGLLPICCYCKSIRDDQNYWQRVEHYIAADSDVRFSHGICPDSDKKVIEPQLVAAGIDPQQANWPQP
jgi:DNA-binding response OmpR family regulator